MMRRLQLIDKWSLLATLTLSFMGVAFIRSATRMDEGSILWIKQCVWIVAGLIIYVVIGLFDYKKLVGDAKYYYIGGVLSLILVLLFGDRINGARSWFRLPFMSLQPSEFVKITTVLILAKYFTKYQQWASSLREFTVSAFLVGVPLGLIVMQPDLGTALVFLPLIFLPNFLMGNKESLYLAAVGGLLVGVLVLGVVHKPDWVFFLKNYQKDRIIAFVYPEQDTSNRGYQVHQSKISIGQGGMFGMGFGEGQQTRMGFLPAQHNDFILAVAAEEFGFMGMLFIFGMFLVIFLRAFATALAAEDPMGSFLVILVISVLLMQMLFNAAMMVGLVPTTGIPCPLLSYGGSSYLATMGLLGLIQSVRTHRFFA